MANLFRQRGRCVLDFYANGGTGPTRPGTSSFKVLNQSDVVSVQLTKSIGQAAGGFSLSLVPRQAYLDKLRADDWLVLTLSSGAVTEEFVFLIDTVNLSTVTTERGTTETTIRVSGRDYGKVFLSTTLIVDPILGKYVEPALFEGEVLVRKFSDNEIPYLSPDGVVRNLLTRYHDNRIQCLPPPALTGRDLVIDFGTTRGFVVSNSEPNLTGNLWATMGSYAHSLLNEFYVDTVGGRPTLFLHERPYGRNEFASLTGYSVLSTESIDISLSKSDNDVRNWFRVYPDAQYLPTEAIDVAQIGYVNNDSIARHGLRRMEATTNAFGLGGAALPVASEGTPTDLVETFSGLLAEWNAQNEQLLSGTITCRMRPDIRVGNRLDYFNPRTKMRVSFFIEGVSHTWAYPGAGTTTISVTRGTPAELQGNQLKFPNLKTLQQLVDEGVLQPFEKFSPPVPEGL